MSSSVFPVPLSGIQEGIIAAKGDLIVGTANDTPGILSVGTNGYTLVADSSASTGLRWQGDYAAGKNKIINGDFTINQRAFSSTTTNATYGFDRWVTFFSGGTVTYSAQTFTPGTAPVTGYESKNYARLVTTSQTLSSHFAQLNQKIEDVRTFANQTVTVSFWAKAASGTPKIGVTAIQNFGSGGSPSSAVVTSIGSVTLSTSWARYSITTSIPSISGKTIGTTDNTSSLEIVLNVSLGTDYPSYGNIGLQNNTFDIWGVQVEAGSVATAFQTATGTLAGELAACQRYYFRWDATVNDVYAFGVGDTSTRGTSAIRYPVTMRIAPSAFEFSNLALLDMVNSKISVTSAVFDDVTVNGATILATVASGVTQYRPYFLVNNTTNGFVGFTSEL